jgi:hypothetical protein
LLMWKDLWKIDVSSQSVLTWLPEDNFAPKRSTFQD